MSKHGFQKGIQRYKCAACGKVFQGGHRIDNVLLWQEYTEGKQTYMQLATRYGCSVKSIQRKLDKVSAQKSTIFSSVANVLMDTNLFWSKAGCNGIQRQPQWADIVQTVCETGDQ